MSGRPPTKTQRALALFDQNPDWSPFKCAMQVGLTPSALYAAIRAREAALDGRCPACGRPIKKVTATTPGGPTPPPPPP